MVTPIVQFVDLISTTATLRYDFNASSPTLRAFPLGADAIDFGVPPYDGDPGGVGGRYGYRSMKFTQRIIGTKSVALARMQLLARELLRETNYLKFAWDAVTTPVFFKTYRMEPGALTLENAGNADAWDITVPLVAEPFAYGPRVTHSQVQVIQGPADLTGPTRTAMRVVLPAIKGDAPTALRVAVSPANTCPSYDTEWLFGCISGSASMTDPIIDIGTGDGLTAGTNTGAGVANAAYFNGSYRLASIAASDNVAGNNLSVRISGTLPAVQPGRYKVLVRCEIDTAATGFKDYLFSFGLVVAGGSAITYGTSTTVRVGQVGNPGATTRQGWVDLGDVTLPFELRVPDDVTSGNPTSPFGIKVGTADNSTGACRLDAVKLIPVDGRTVTSAKLLTVASTGHALAVNTLGTIDGDIESYYNIVPALSAFSAAPCTLAGSYPVADPAAPQNLLVLIAITAGRATGGTASATTYISSLNAQAAVDVSYYPRYLHIGDGT